MRNKPKRIQHTNKHNNNIIFLDIDGVFTSFRCEMTTEVTRIWSKLDPIVIEFFNRMWFKYDITFVLCSTWRQFYDTKQINAIFQAAGFQGQIICCTQHKGSNHHKPTSILSYLNEHRPKNWMVVDDEPNSYKVSDPVFNEKTVVPCDGENGLMFRGMLQIEETLEEWCKNNAISKD